MSKSDHIPQVVETLTEEELADLAANADAVREIRRELRRRGGDE